LKFRELPQTPSTVAHLGSG